MHFRMCTFPTFIPVNTRSLWPINRIENKNIGKQIFDLQETKNIYKFIKIETKTKLIMLKLILFY